MSELLPEVNNNETPLKYTANQIAYLSLRKEGLTQSEAAREVGISAGYGSQLESRVKGKYDLTDTKLVKKAYKAVKCLIEGKPVGTVEKVKDSTVLAAASMVMDRAQPVVKHVATINQTFVTYDLKDSQNG